MQLPLSIFLLCLLFTGCKKEGIIQDPRYQKFQGHWRGVHGTQETDVFLKKNGVAEVQYENERVYRFRVHDITNSMSSQPVKGKYMRVYSFKKNFNGGLVNSVNFYEDTTDGTIYCFSKFVDNGADFIDTTLLFKVERL